MDKTVAVVGAGVAGLACAWSLAKSGIQVTVLEMSRGLGGRTSQRREISPAGVELHFDHGAPSFSLHDPALAALGKEWRSLGIVADWTGRFGTLDAASGSFKSEQVPKTRVVGVPGMNALCKAMAATPGVSVRCGVQVTNIERDRSRPLWNLSAASGETFGPFGAVICAVKGVATTHFPELTGLQTPLGANSRDLHPNVCGLRTGAAGVQTTPCFAAMLAFDQPLSNVPFDGATVIGSSVLAWAGRDSSKPGRSPVPECWVLHSTPEYGATMIARAPVTSRPPPELLREAAEEMHAEFAKCVGGVPREALLSVSHRWGSAFPIQGIASDIGCVVDKQHKAAVCGDFCTTSSVDGALRSGLSAGKEIFKLLEGSISTC